MAALSPSGVYPTRVEDGWKKLPTVTLIPPTAILRVGGALAKRNIPTCSTL